MPNFDSFKKRAEEKGFKFRYNPENILEIEAPSELHIDMIMVDLSIESAINNVKSIDLKEKLQVLLRNGTNAQKIEFVYGTGSYYFPEDLEMIAQRAINETNDNKICQPVCEIVTRIVCRCLAKSNEQICSEIARNVCRIICS